MFFVKAFTLNVCAHGMPVREVPVVFGVITTFLSLFLALSLTLYSDCLQARRHFPVKVSLMNSNDPTECLRQVIHNHSSFTFPPPHHPSAASSLAFFLSALTPSSCHCNRQHFLELVIIYSVSLFISFFFNGYATESTLYEDECVRSLL